MKWTSKRFKKAAAALVSVSMAVTLGGVWPSAAVSAQTDASKFTGASIPAFPGAEGGGAYTSGGRGGDVYIVTNLQDYGENDEPIEGSLRHGVLTTPPEGRTIVFHVSGTIELKRSLRMDNIKNLTIAGQTAPGNGITLAGWDTNISNSENIIIRYMAFRPGATNVFNGSDSMDALWGRDNNFFIIDHSSFSWNTDETLSLYRGENGTVQWSLISESLTLSGHSKGRHGYGGIAGGDKTTFHNNLYAHHTSRNPRLGGGYAGAADAEHVAVVQLSNNVIYNFGFNGTYGGGFNFANYTNNMQLAGPGTRDNVEDRVIDAGEVGKLGGFYIAGNVVNGKSTGILDGASEYVKHSGDDSGDHITTYPSKPYASTDSTGVNKGVANPGFDEYASSGVRAVDETMLTDILERAGATYPRRDAIDARIVAEVQDGLGRFINTEHEVGGYVSPFGVIEEQRPADFDTNRNGMDDAWEKEKGIFDTKDAYRTITDSGYSWLELYINGLVEMDHAADNPDAVLASPVNNAQYVLGEAIPVEIQTTSKLGHRIEKVAVYNGSEYLGDAELQGDKYVYEIEGLKDTFYFISARVTDSKGNATQTTAANIHVSADSKTLADGGWTSADIGAPDLAGTGSLIDGVLTVKGNGKLGMSEGSTEQSPENNAAKDDFHFVYQEMTGDLELTAKLEKIGSVDNHAFTGLMIRDELTDDSATAALGLSWVKISNAYPWSAYLTGRDNQGGSFDELTETLDSEASAKKVGIQLLPDLPFKINGVEQGYWMKLGRKGDTFYAYGSFDGKEWTPIGERTVKMKDSVYVGFAVDSNDVANEIEQLNEARFSNVSVNSGFKPISNEVEMGPLVKVDGLTEIDSSNLLTVKQAGDKIILEQNAAEGRMTKSTASLASNISYLVFPKSSGKASIEMDVTITSKTSKSNDMGLYVGAFQIGDGKELFSSLGFRNGESQSLTGIWSKLGKDNLDAGNGSSATNNGSTNTKPSYVLNQTYHVKFEKNADGYVVHYTGVDENGDAIDASKVFKATEAVLSSKEYMGQEVQLGFALSGVTAEIENLVLKDEFDRTMYSQKPIELAEVDPSEQLTVTKEQEALILKQTATEGLMTKSTAKLASNVSYYVFPATSDNQTMEMDITILDKASESNDMGLYVGAFRVGDGEELFSSLGFRNGASQTLTGIWSKVGKENLDAGNGSSATNNGSTNTKPSYVANQTYHVKFEKSDAGHTVYYTGVDENGAAIDAYKVFKATEAVLSSADYLGKETQFGFALTGVTAKVENLVLSDGYGNVLYKLNGGTAEQPKEPVKQPEAEQPKGQDEYVVQSGDSLYAIAKKVYGNGALYTIIYEANKDIVKQPDLIFIGQKLAIPSR
jgi:LysM repeat protein